MAAGKRITVKHFRLAAAQVDPSHTKTSRPRKVAKSTSKAAQEALDLVSSAERAAMQGDQKGVQTALAAIRRCLVPLAPPAVTEAAVSSTLTTDAKNATIGGPQVDPTPTPTEPEGSNNHSISAESIAGTKPHVASPSALETELSPPETPVQPANTAGFSKAQAQPAVILMGTSGVPISKWNEVPLFVANWLLEEGVVLSNIPFIKRQASAFPASARLKPLNDGSFIELGDDRSNLLRKTRRLLNVSGHRNIPFAVQLSNGTSIDI